MSNIQSILHHSVLVADVQVSLAFYCGLLELALDDARPDLGYPGAWLTVGEGQQIHLLQLPNPDPVTDRPTHGGRDRHLALAVGDVDMLADRLQVAGITFTRSKSGRAALFCRDPDGNALEFVQCTR